MSSPCRLPPAGRSSPNTLAGTCRPTGAPSKHPGSGAIAPRGLPACTPSRRHGSVCPALALCHRLCRTAGPCRWPRNPMDPRCTRFAGWTVSARLRHPGVAPTGSPCQAFTAPRKPTAPKALAMAAGSRSSCERTCRGRPAWHPHGRAGLGSGPPPPREPQPMGHFQSRSWTRPCGSGA